MDKNLADVLIALTTMAGSLFTVLIGAYLTWKLKVNTDATNKTLQIVNGERDGMKLEIIELKKQLAAVQIVLALEQKHNPVAVERVAAAIEVVKKQE